MVAPNDSITNKTKRIEAIRLALRASQEAGQRQHALGEAEFQKQNAEQQLAQAEDKVEECFEKLSQSAQTFNESMVYIREAFSPERTLPGDEDPQVSTLEPKPKIEVPGTPKTPGNVKQEITYTPGSPIPRTPGGTIRTTMTITPEGEKVEVGSNYPAYIVYIGPRNQHRFFTSWRSIPEKGIEGAQNWVAGVNNTYIKGFTPAK
ncbi:hypothetical protein MPER_08458, partial [Moniliophthora perniciosa FA553]